MARLELIVPGRLSEWIWVFSISLPRIMYKAIHSGQASEQAHLFNKRNCQNSTQFSSHGASRSQLFVQLKRAMHQGLQSVGWLAGWLAVDHRQHRQTCIFMLGFGQSVHWSVFSFKRTHRHIYIYVALFVMNDRWCYACVQRLALAAWNANK